MARSARPSKQSKFSYPKNLRQAFRRMAKTVNLYSQWDNSVNPRYLMWELYKEPISLMRDERAYSNRAMDYLTERGQLLDEYIEIEDRSPMDDDDPGAPGVLSSFYDSGQQSKKILYKDNLIVATLSDDMTYSFEFFRPLSKSFVNEEISQWVLERKGESKVSILVQRGGGLATQKVSFAPPVIGDLEINYGTGFKSKYDLLVDKLNMRKSGIILMHGCPGSGKSTMLKHLSSIVNREWIFCPVNLADRLASPDFISLLMNKKEAVLILEDAEQAVQSRENSIDSSCVSTLLNLSDGILGTMLNLTCIISFNFNRDGIDPALMRPGRLLMDIDFPPLSIEDAQRLSDKLGFDRKIDKPMTLAEIYNQNVETNYAPPSPTKRMGFHAFIPPLSLTPKSASPEEKKQDERKS